MSNAERIETNPYHPLGFSSLFTIDDVYEFLMKKYECYMIIAAMDV